MLGHWPTGTMPALAITGPREVDQIRIGIPPPLPGTALVRPSLVGLCGTDLELFHGTASYLLDGRGEYPLVFGHEWCGTVVAVPDGTGLRVGDRVVGQTMLPCGLCRSCQRGRRSLCGNLAEVGLYGQQGAAAQYVRMPVRSLIPLPTDLPDAHAALIEPAVTVVEAFERVVCGADDRVAVVGTGTMGLLAVQFAARRVGVVDAVGVDEAGLALAGRCGARLLLRPGEPATGGYSVVIEASGASSAFLPALDLLEPGGRMAVVGVAGEPAVGFQPGDLPLRGVDLIGVRHGLDQYPAAITLMSGGVLNPALLIADIQPPSAARAAFDRLEHGRNGPPKLLLDVSDWSGSVDAGARDRQLVPATGRIPGAGGGR